MIIREKGKCNRSFVQKIISLPVVMKAQTLLAHAGPGSPSQWEHLVWPTFSERGIARDVLVSRGIIVSVTFHIREWVGLGQGVICWIGEGF